MCLFLHFDDGFFQGLPCHLYFDLEFNKRDNPEKDGDEMVDLLISITLEALLDKYSIEGNEDWIVELDSSTTGTIFCLVLNIHSFSIIV